jgi:DNA-binding transcriptional MerR regulator
LRDSTGKSPDAYRTIGEASEAIGVPQHVLRFWESRFSQVRPVKRAGNRRYYRPGDIALLKRIRQLLHEEGYSIRGVQRLLKEGGVKGLLEEDAPPPAEPPAIEPQVAVGPARESAAGDQQQLREILDELVEIRDLLR